ncbi:hypothetical protein ACFIOY_39945 [Bradyrhizobium sp. TZ2]
MLAFATLPMCFGMAAIIPELLPMLYGSDFSDASLAAATVAQASGRLLPVPAAFTIGLERSDLGVLSNISGAIPSVVLGFLLVPRIVGAAICRRAVQLFFVVLTF